MTCRKVVGVGGNVTVFGWPVRYLVLASYSCHCASFFNPTAKSNDECLQESKTCSVFKDS